MSLIKYVYSQFGRPRGLLGYVAGNIMARRPSNIERNDWALSLLAIKPADRVLEIGFGPGIAAGNAAIKAAEVVGLDRSALMLRQAIRRNKELIEQGKLKLMLGSVEDLTNEIGSFDKIYSMNVVHFWREPVAVLRRLKIFLKPGGVILTGYMPRHAGAKDEDAVRKGGQIEDWLRETGFEHVRTETRLIKLVTVVAVLATLS
jgi:SAM-dependent methyltransferase